jgi:hypothetical protein
MAGPWEEYQSPSAGSPPAPPAGPWENYGGGGGGGAAPNKSFISDVGDTLKQYWDKVNPVKQVQGLASAAAHPIDTVKNYLANNSKIADAAIDSAKAGDYSQAARHTLSYFLQAIPGLGSAIDEAGNKGAQGDVKGMIADTAALATNIAEGKALPAAAEALSEPGLAADAAQAVRSTARATAEGAKAAAPDLAAGAAKTAGGAALMKYGPNQMGDVVAGAPIVRGGVAQVGSGFAKGVQAFRQALADDAAAQESERLASQSIPPQAGPVSAQPQAAGGPVLAPAPQQVSGAIKPVQLADTLTSSRAVLPQQMTRPTQMLPNPREGFVGPVPAGPAPAAPATATPAESVEPIPQSSAPVLPGARLPLAQEPGPTLVPTSDPNVVWDPERGHIDVRTGKPPQTEPDAVIVPRAAAEEIVEKLQDPSRFYGKYSLKPNSPAQIQRNSDALKMAEAVRKGNPAEAAFYAAKIAKGDQ